MLDQWLTNTLLRARTLPEVTVYPNETIKMHTFYGGAHLLRANTFGRLREIGLSGFEHFFPTPAFLAQWFARVVAPLGEIQQKEGTLWLPSVMDAPMLEQVHESLKARVDKAFIEDYRIDFEDGFGIHSNEKTYDQARRTAAVFSEMLLAFAAQSQFFDPPPEMGIRLKPLSIDSREQAIRILCVFMDTLADKLGSNLADSMGQIPRFWITIPKCECSQEVRFMLEALDELEMKLGLPQNTLGLEIMLESRSAVMALGRGNFLNSWLPHKANGAKGRATALVMGAFDTCAQWEILSAAQGHAHPLLDLVRLQAVGWGLQVGVPVIDSITRAVPKQEGDQTPTFLHARHVLHSMSMGVHAGWDIHPLQSLVRHAVVLMVIAQTLPDAVKRLGAFQAAKSHASRVGVGFDDLATVRGLCTQISRALRVGLTTEQHLKAQGISWPPKWIESPDIQPSP